MNWGDSITGTWFPKKNAPNGSPGQPSGWSGGGARPFHDTTTSLSETHKNNAPYNYTQWDDYMRAPEGQMFARDSANYDAVLEKNIAYAGQDPFSLQGKYLKGMLGQLSTGYKALLGTNPMYTGTFHDYVKEQLPILQKTFLGLTADQQGQNVGRFTQPMRTISRGE